MASGKLDLNWTTVPGPVDFCATTGSSFSFSISFLLKTFTLPLSSLSLSLLFLFFHVLFF